MATEENSISIINRSGGQVSGENTNALPIKLVTNISWMKSFAAGFFTALIVVAIFVSAAKTQVVAVEVSGQANNYQELQLK